MYRYVHFDIFINVIKTIEFKVYVSYIDRLKVTSKVEFQDLIKGCYR